MFSLSTVFFSAKRTGRLARIRAEKNILTEWYCHHRVWRFINPLLWCLDPEITHSCRSCDRIFKSLFHKIGLTAKPQCSAHGYFGKLVKCFQLQNLHALLPRLLSLAAQADLDKLFVVPRIFHLRMMQDFAIFDIWSIPEIFLCPSSDLWCVRIPSHRSSCSSFDLKLAITLTCTITHETL